MKKIIAAMCFVFLWSCLFPAAEDSQIIESITIYGNKKVKEKVIRRVITLKEGRELKKKDIADSRKRLNLLDVFSTFDIEMKDGEKGVLIIISVKEKKTFYFNPVISFNNEDTDQYNEESELDLYGVEVGKHDFSGRRNSFSLTAGAGSMNKLQFSGRKDYFSGLFWGMDIANLWYKSDIFDSKIEIFTGRVYLGKQLGENWLVRLWSEYTMMRWKEIPAVAEPENLIKAGAVVRYDTRDWDLYPLRGMVVGVGGYKTLDEKGNKIYDRLTIECSSFFNLFKQYVLALGVRGILSDGMIPLRDKIYFGGYRTLRGLPIGKYAGNSSLVVSGEFRIPISRMNKDAKRAQFLGAAIYLFADAGILADEVKNFSFDHIEYNTGLGFAWLLDRESVFRIDVTMAPKVRITVSTGWKF
ncbi:MAG: BamA/TamA family outer membrane protein [bacterium]|nr:BamA/TamA family outer membrane protein [bacterium]